MVVGRGQHECTGDCQESVREDAHVFVCDCSADDENQEACRAACYNASIPVATEADAQCDNAEWHDNDEHLCMQMTVVELSEQRQTSHDERQQQAMDEAQRRQQDCGAIEPSGRVRRIWIVHGLPLCCAKGAGEYAHCAPAKRI